MLTLREMLWKGSPARAQLLGMCDDFQERQKLKGDPREVAGKAVVEELKPLCRFAYKYPRDEIRIILGKRQYEAMVDYAYWQSEYSDWGIPNTGDLHFRSMRIVPVDDEDYAGVFRSMPNAWVPVESEDAA